MSNNRPLHAYLDAGRYMMAMSTEFELPISIWVTYLGAAIWSERRIGEVPMSLEELAARTGKTPQATSAHLRYLGERYRLGKNGMGLVRTHEHPLNGRMKTFTLTAKGRAVAEHLRFIYNRQDGNF